VKRYHDEISLMNRREKLWAVVVGKARERGYFRKKKPFDCGISRCGVCHAEAKFPKRTPTRQERMNDQQQDYGS
jgi:hypothetical protein